MSALTFVLRPETFSIWRLPPDARIDPAWLDCRWCSITRSDDELSLVVPEHVALQGECEPGWSCLQVVGPLDFSLVGIVAGIAGVLAEARVSVFVVSTYATDHVLVRTRDVATAIGALTKAGHRVTPL